MATSVIELNTTWQEVAVGACLVTVAQVDDPSGVEQTLQSDLETPWVLLHIGASAPAQDTFDFHEFRESANYGGIESVYCRTVSGTRIVKVSPIVTQ